jgi:hypothetical protein
LASLPQACRRLHAVTGIFLKKFLPIIILFDKTSKTAEFPEFSGSFCFRALPRLDNLLFDLRNNVADSLVGKGNTALFGNLFG